MEERNWQEIESAKAAALKVLLHNARGSFQGLPRTAGWGYPEPYTRDLMLAAIGIAVSGNEALIKVMRKTMTVLASNQSPRGQMPSMVHDAGNRGASDTTPLFLLAAGIYRKLFVDGHFLEVAVRKALTWMEYQSPSDDVLVAQQPTSDWRDEQWVLGFGLFVNTTVYAYLRMLGLQARADELRKEMRHFTITDKVIHHHVHEGLMVKNKPYFALWSYKVYSSERFDLLGNSMAILSGLAPLSRAQKMVSWIEEECSGMRQRGDLAVDLAPNFFPFIYPGHPDWMPRYADYNRPGDYHNGGIWPFISALYVAALVAAGRPKLAREKLFALTDLVKVSVNQDLEYGFNEWYKAQDGQPKGQDWQTWSAALYLYAAAAVEGNSTPFFADCRLH
jgi:hypothetical protein